LCFCFDYDIDVLQERKENGISLISCSMTHVNRIYLETVDSSNTWAKQHAHEFDRNAMTLIAAGAQSAGRGRFNRRWVSPAGQNIYATFAFFLKTFRQDTPNIPQILSISAAKVIERLGFKPQLKWPNDILLSGKKTAGILCETTSVEESFCVVLGIGLNVNMPPEKLLEIDRLATSLFAEDGKSRDVEEITKLLQQQFCLDLEVFLKEGFPPFLPVYNDYLIHRFNDTLNFHDNQKVVTGKFRGVNLDGSLNLELEQGILHRFYAGEII
jgi:BirA family biotin operon repressor/biotin-[acetyl-CoA-carboxylase] ligase